MEIKEIKEVKLISGNEPHEEEIIQEDIYIFDNSISADLNNKIKTILEMYFGPKKFKFVKIEKLNSGLTNTLFTITYLLKDEVNSTVISKNGPKKIEKLFLKIFGEISSWGLIDRKFETDLIEENSKKGLCEKLVFTDYETFRLEEYLENIQKPSEDKLLEFPIEKDLNEKNELTDCQNFITKVNDAILNFEFSLYKMKEESFQKYSNMEKYSLKAFLEKIIKIAKVKVEIFEKNFQNHINKLEAGACEKNENLEGIQFSIKNLMPKVKFYLENFDEIYTDLVTDSNFDIKEIPLILNHNDVHMHNLLLHNDKLLLIDYEYATLNHIGFDIINYCIESFFDLEYPEYPFFKRKVENVNILYNDPKFFEIYLNFVDKLIVKIDKENVNYNLEKIIKIKNYLKVLYDKNYFIRISGVCSLFWFYCALITLDYDGFINKNNFNYLDYSLERLSIYENAKNLLK
jgi:thiamine kinase-like enzyme